MAEQIAVRLPLSMTTTSRLLEAIGAAWPDAMLKTDEPNSDRHLVVEIDNDTVAGAPIAELGPAPERVTIDGLDVDGFLTSLRDGRFGFSLPEWFTTLQLGCVRDILDHGDAPNYVEQGLYDPDTNERYTVTVGRPGGRTAHELRCDAEARAERCDAALAEIAATGLLDGIDSLSADTVTALRVATDSR